MRIYIVFLIVMTHIFVCQAFSSEVILGTVDTIDDDKGELQLKIMDSSIAKLEDKKVIRVKIMGRNPGLNLKTGDVVRVWGYHDDQSLGVFKAHSITGQACNRPNRDPTGVRSRLGRRSGMGGRKRGHHR